MTIVDFIEQRLAEDEAVARHAADAGTAWMPGPGESWIVRQVDYEGIGIYQPGGFVEGSESPQTEHIARHDPARVLRQVKALRDILSYIDALHSPSMQIEAEGEVHYPIASIWSDHPDYRQEWA